MSTFIQRLGAALLSTILVAVTLLPAADAQSDTFACDPGFYQVIAGQLAQFDPGAGTYDTIGSDNGSYNAMGYRIADGYMYAVAGSNLLRVNSSGDTTVVTELTAGASSYTGDFGDDGLLHVSRGGAEWTKINVETLEVISVPELSISAGMADIANVNGIFYGVSSQGNLIRIDPIALTVDTVGAVQGLPASSMAYGAAWATAGGNLYIGRNSGEIYQITGYSTSSPTATQVGTAPPTNSNDGGSCALAPPPPGLADVDGPEPETEPSTPEAKAAAERYETTYEPTPVPGSQDESSDPQPANNDETYAVEPDQIEGGEVCGETRVEARPPRDLEQPVTSVDTPTVLYSSGFDDGAAGWEFLSGDWQASAGSLDQITECDFDATALLATHTVSNFRWSTSFVANEGRNHAGLLFHQSSPNTRSGASLVDFSDDGSVMRWGSYDNAGFYRFEGMVRVAPAVVGQPVRLSVEVHETSVTVWVDDVPVAFFDTAASAGMVGLVATQSAVAFDAVELVALPVQPAATATEDTASAEQVSGGESGSGEGTASAEQVSGGESGSGEGTASAEKASAEPTSSTDASGNEEPQA